MTIASSYLKAHRKTMKQVVDAYSAADLKQISKGLGLPVSGTKNDLVSRLLELGYPL